MTDKDKDPKEERIPKRDPNRKPEEYEFSHILVSLSLNEPFLGAIATRILKFEDWTVPTAYVSYSKKTNRFIMGYNPEFFARATDDQVMWILKHELYHVILGHITTRYTDKTKFKKIMNIAQDLAINSIIDGPKRHPAAIVPGVFPEKCKDLAVGLMISQLPKQQSMEFYFEKLKDFADNSSKKGCPVCNKNKKDKTKGNDKGNQENPEKNEGQDANNNQSDPGNSSGDGDGDGEEEQDGGSLCNEHGGKYDLELGDENGETIDIHDFEQIPEDGQEIANEQLKEILKKGAENAQDKRNWGSVPNNIKQAILDIIKPEINWKSILKYFIGSRMSAQRDSSIKRINKKFPYVFPGIKRKTQANFVFFIDNSGSMGQDDVKLALGAALECSKEVKIHVYNFDTSVDEENVQVWTKGSQKDWKRTRNGGTAFRCIYDFLTKQENKGKWGGAAIVTDGAAEKIPFIPGVKIIWLITPGGTTEYIEPESLVVKMTKDKTAKKL